MAAVAWAQAGDAESVNTNAAANNVSTTIHRLYVSEKTWRVMVDPPHTRSRSGLCGIVPQLSAVGLYSMDSGPTQFGPLRNPTLHKLLALPLKCCQSKTFIIANVVSSIETIC
jgi:hypothetical protein